MADEDLITDEGVDEGSKDPEPTEHPDPTGPSGSPPPDTAAPVPPAMTPEGGDGQQLAEGEG